MNKIQPSPDEAIRDLSDGATVMVGGFGLCGNPENLIAALARKGARNLTLISNNCGTTDQGRPDRQRHHRANSVRPTRQSSSSPATSAARASRTSG